MRINSGPNPNSATGVSAPQTQAAESSSTKKSEQIKKQNYTSSAEASQQSTSSAKADISSRAKDMAKAKQVAQDTPDVREAKIAELKEKIANKSYRVDANAIADKLVDDHIKLAGA